VHLPEEDASGVEAEPTAQEGVQVQHELEEQAHG